MIKKICDKCKKNISDTEISKHPFYFTNGWGDIDLCVDCFDKFEEYKAQIINKYEPKIAELQEKEIQEIEVFLGIRSGNND